MLEGKTFRLHEDSRGDSVDLRTTDNNTFLLQVWNSEIEVCDVMFTREELRNFIGQIDLLLGS